MRGAGKDYDSDGLAREFWAEYIGSVVATIQELGLENEFDVEHMLTLENINYNIYHSTN